jgi:RimJ/RimL family protein N-acetyltransferase
MIALPPNKKENDKFYLGYFKGEDLVAVLDLIINYPDDKTAYIGLFMMNRQFQGKGIGTKIIEDLSLYLKKNGFNNIRLAFAKGNPQSEAFWLKNHFIKTGVESDQVGYTAIIMQKYI